MKVAFQGEIGAFSEEAVRALYPEGEPVAMKAFEDVFGAVEAGEVDRGVIPIENSLFGSVHVNYDLLRSHNLWILAEWNLRIRHHLLGAPGSSMDQIQEVRSHPQALGQCQTFLKSHLPEARRVPAYDTAGSAKWVAETGDTSIAAIASAQAGKEYGLTFLAEGIESNQMNYTRFLALARRDEGEPTMPARLAGHEGSIKTSIVYAMRENVPGVLFKSLAVFALRDFDLLKIESRPLVGTPGSYVFYLDLEGSLTNPSVQRALEHLSEITAFVKVLGSYPKRVLTP